MHEGAGCEGLPLFACTWGAVPVIGPTLPLHYLCTAPAPLLHRRLQRTPGLDVEIPEDPPPGTPAGGNPARLCFRKGGASMELSVAHSMLPAMRFIASRGASSFYASELPGVDE